MNTVAIRRHKSHKKTKRFVAAVVVLTVAVVGLIWAVGTLREDIDGEVSSQPTGEIMWVPEADGGVYEATGEGATCSIQPPSVPSETVVVSMTDALRGSSCEFKGHIRSNAGIARLTDLDVVGLPPGWTATMTATCGKAFTDTPAGNVMAFKITMGSGAAISGESFSLAGSSVGAEPDASFDPGDCT